MECETAYEDGVPLEEAYKLGDGVDTCVVTVNVSDSTQNEGTFCLVCEIFPFSRL
jgi:hypothetical protein